MRSELNPHRAAPGKQPWPPAPESGLDVAGHLDLCGPELCEGWICWRREPNMRFVMEVFADGKLLGQCEANLFRPDLRQAGYADGCYAFTFPLPPSMSVRDFSSTRVRIQNSILYLLPDQATKVWQEANRADRGALRAVG